MRRQLARAGKGIVVLVILLIMCCIVSNLRSVQKKHWGRLCDLDTAVDMKTAKQILQSGLQDKEKSGISIIFFTRQEKKVLENAEWFRQVNTDVFEICGDSTLLFYNGYPLEPVDQKGCLIGEKTVLALFGGKDNIGEEVIYDGNIYEIRGILRDKDIFVIQADENTLLDNVGIFGRNEMEQTSIAEWLQNAFGLNIHPYGILDSSIFWL